MLSCRASRRCFQAGRPKLAPRLRQSVAVYRGLLAHAAAVSNDTGVSSTKVADEVEKKKEFEDAYDVSTLTVEQVHELINVVSEETKLAEVTVKLEDLEVRFRRSAGDVPVPLAPPPVLQALQAPATMSPSAPPMLDIDVVESADSYDDFDDLSKVKVCANKVGVYHRVRFGGGRALSKKPIVDVGSSVRKGQALGCIEQMGAITTIEAPTGGIIASVCTEEGEFVEFDQPVYEIQPEMASSGSRIK